MASNSLIPHDNASPQCQDTLIRRGVGLTMAQIIHEGGKVATRILNAGYEGPLKPKSYIKIFFSEAEKRERALDDLYKADRDNLTKKHKKLLNHCHDLLKYALPERTIATQLVTFKILVAIIPRYPGIRHLFHHPKGLNKELPPVASDFENLWNRPHQACDEEWTFYRDFAVYCLIDSDLTKLVEGELPSAFGQLELLGDLNWNKAPVESLLSFCGPDLTLNHEKICAIHYLAGILELPKFWRLKTEEGIDIAKRLFGFLSLLCETIVQLIRDTEPSNSDDSEDSSPRWNSARIAVDILTFSTFNGLIQLHGLGEKLPHCPSQLSSIVFLLMRSEMKGIFPKASSIVRRVEEIINRRAQNDDVNQPPSGLDIPSHRSSISSSQNPASNLSPNPFGNKAKYVKTVELKEEDIIIAVMGPTGSGKSTFITVATGVDVGVGHNLASSTSEISLVKMSFLGYNVVFVDTPGFDNTWKSEIDVLKMISNWLEITFQRKILLSGLLYFRRISDNRMAATPLQNLHMFEQLYGKKSFKNVILTTTMWDEVDEETGNLREEELKTKYWKSMISRRSTTGRFIGTRDSAFRLIAPLLDEANERNGLLLQRELVDLDLSLSETHAGRYLRSEIRALAKQQQEMLHQIQEALKYPNNAVSLQALMEVDEELKKSSASLLQQVADLQVPLGR